MSLRAKLDVFPDVNTENSNQPRSSNRHQDDASAETDAALRLEGRKLKEQSNDGQQASESPMGKSSSEGLREDLRKPLRGSLCDLVFLSSVPL